ncbi:AEC family transporter [Arcobacter cryaerophilus gv. pseudocryaerophilus]|jgi:predicted permease|uniref:AEC family transporter n=3 Tax=unclassified Arcobacter TaxID=2593671 RepID=A0AA96IDS5_9BACT|nr:AEC family transporter [Aliarcobacter cryaerophilus]WNL27301.1 AEC family transporter [Arcobacter sp. AZ-2023]WPD05546.1 AEC family transporter [Arcobacter sp. DSM 115956]WPD07638.1 AEC family transporter [Arcobacter sp. DSM 115955]MCT7472251.1 AEC family transporter [Aliarcobacter cryaerophilus]WNL31904.1 AEC family transporter [Arcobacter sp. AZ-2023]
MLDPVLPIAIYLLFGYLFKIIFQDNSKQLVDFIIYFSLPAIVFSKIYPLELDTKILWLILMFMAIIFFNLFLSYCVGKMMRLNRVTLATFMIMATFGNTSFIGFSYIDAFYGQDYIVYGVIYDIFGSFLLLVSVGMIIITWGSGRKNSILNISKSIFLFPPMIIFFITIFAKNFEVPKFIIYTSQNLGSTLVPIAMIAIGMKLELKHIFSRLHIVTVAVVLKMLIVPIIILFTFKYFYGVDETWVKVTLIEVAMPPMTMAAVLAIKGGLDEKIAINSLVLGVIVSLFTITLFTSYLA